MNSMISKENKECFNKYKESRPVGCGSPEGDFTLGGQCTGQLLNPPAFRRSLAGDRLGRLHRLQVVDRPPHA